MAVRVLIPIPFDFLLVLCRRSAPLASSIYRVCTLPPVLCTYVALRKGFWLYKNVGHLNTCSLNCVILNSELCNSKSGPIAQVFS